MDMVKQVVMRVLKVLGIVSKEFEDVVSPFTKAATELEALTQRKIVAEAKALDAVSRAKLAAVFHRENAEKAASLRATLKNTLGV